MDQQLADVSCIQQLYSEQVVDFAWMRITPPLKDLSMRASFVVLILPRNDSDRKLIHDLS